MDFQTCSLHVMPSSAPDVPNTWEDVVRIALNARKNGATPSEVARVAKTLARLGTAAAAVTASHHTSTPSVETQPEHFDDVLKELAHG